MLRSHVEFKWQKLVCQIIWYVDDNAIILLNYKSNFLYNVFFKSIKLEYCLLIQRTISFFFFFLKNGNTIFSKCWIAFDSLLDRLALHVASKSAGKSTPFWKASIGRSFIDKLRGKKWSRPSNCEISFFRF